ncbi:short-chain dehydrogenase/reductase SDR [Raoultella ornithinolytica]|nr:short-chain dehydrogenase/reductase SDR [Raoultella ornithinolytica]
MHEAELKLFGVINPVKAFQAQLERSDIASITCVNSLLALQPEEHMIATSAARAALLNMTLTLSKELISKGIRVNSILLGMVESGQWQRRFENRADKRQSWPEWTADIARKRGIPMARLGKPQEPAQALLFLASPAGIVYHRRRAGCLRRFLPSPVRSHHEKNYAYRLWRHGASGD